MKYNTIKFDGSRDHATFNTQIRYALQGLIQGIRTSQKNPSTRLTNFDPAEDLSFCQGSCNNLI